MRQSLGGPPSGRASYPYIAMAGNFFHPTRPRAHMHIRLTLLTQIVTFSEKTYLHIDYTILQSFFGLLAKQSTSSTMSLTAGFVVSLASLVVSVGVDRRGRGTGPQAVNGTPEWHVFFCQFKSDRIDIQILPKPSTTDTYCIHRNSIQRHNLLCSAKPQRSFQRTLLRIQRTSRRCPWSHL